MYISYTTIMYYHVLQHMEIQVCVYIYTHYLCIIYTLYIYTLYIRYIYVIYTLYIRYIYVIYTLYIRYIYVIYTLIFTLYIRYIYVIYTLYIHVIYTLYIRYIYIHHIFIHYIYIVYIYIYIIYGGFFKWCIRKTNTDTSQAEATPEVKPPAGAWCWVEKPMVFTSKKPMDFTWKNGETWEKTMVGWGFHLEKVGFMLFYGWFHRFWTRKRRR